MSFGSGLSEKAGYVACTVASASMPALSENDDAPFSDKVKRSPYKYILGVRRKYRVYLNKDSYHWYIMLHHEEEGSTYPFLTIEINTDNCVKIIPVMKELQREEVNTNHENFDIEITLNTICQTADKVVAEMKEYNLITSNCQLFCKKLLEKLKPAS